MKRLLFPVFVVLVIASGCITITVPSDNQMPTAYIDSVSPDDASLGETVTFSGHGTDRDGKVVSEDIPCEEEENGPKMLQRPLCYFYDAVNGKPSSAVLNEQAVFNFSCLRAVYDRAETGQPQTVINLARRSRAIG